MAPTLSTGKGKSCWDLPHISSCVEICGTLYSGLASFIDVHCHSSLQITYKRGKSLKQVEDLRYLVSVIHAQGGSEEDIKARIAAAWKKWKELTGVLCD